MSQSFSSFMLRSYFLQNCEKAGSNTCDEYETFMESFKTGKSYDDIIKAINKLSKRNKDNVNIAELLRVLKDTTNNKDDKDTAIQLYLSKQEK